MEPLSRLGILWFLPAGSGGSRLAELSRPAADIALIGGFRTLETGHVDHWRVIVRDNPALRGIPYDAFPRGRANYREADDAWLLLMDRQLMRPAFLDLVIKAWTLPRARLTVMTDPHYRSTRKIGLPCLLLK